MPRYRVTRTRTSYFDVEAEDETEAIRLAEDDPGEHWSEDYDHFTARVTGYLDDEVSPQVEQALEAFETARRTAIAWAGSSQEAVEANAVLTEMEHILRSVREPTSREQRLLDEKRELLTDMKIDVMTRVLDLPREQVDAIIRKRESDAE